MCALLVEFVKKMHIYLFIYLFIYHQCGLFLKIYYMKSTKNLFKLQVVALKEKKKKRGKMAGGANTLEATIMRSISNS